MVKLGIEKFAMVVLAKVKNLNPWYQIGSRLAIGKNQLARNVGIEPNTQINS